MLRLTTALLVTAACLTAASPEETAVRALVQKYVDARESRDPKAVATLFTDDADQLTSEGVWRKGREQVTTGSMASSQRTGGKRTITVESVRFLSPTVAIADGRYSLTGMAGGATRNMWTSIIAAKTASGWRIAAIRNMLPSTLSQPASGGPQGPAPARPAK